MSSPFPFDFTQRNYGPATAVIRQLMTEWSEIEWLSLPRIDRPSAHQLFGEHHLMTSALLPAKLAPRVELVPVTGGWAEFAALCHKARNNTVWDWKYSVLKLISLAHSRAHGWTKEERFRQLDTAPDLGDLFLRMGDGIIWCLQWHWPDFRGTLGAHAESARFYYEYCTLDFLECIEWQLAEPGAALERNPFYPLLRLYAAGYYPFSLGPDSVVLFSFAQPE